MRYLLGSLAITLAGAAAWLLAPPRTTHPGHPPVTERRVPVPSATVDLSPRVHGRVLRAGGEPLDGVVVELRVPGWQLLGRAESTDDGRFAVPLDTYEGRAMLSLQRVGWNPVHREIYIERAVIDLGDLELAWASLVVIEVRDERGDPVAFVDVEGTAPPKATIGDGPVDSRDYVVRGRTSDAGIIEFGGLPPGEWVFHLRGDGLRARTPATASVRGSSKQRCVIRAVRLRETVGWFDYGSGNPVVGASVERVRTATEDAAVLESTTTDESGRFVLPPPVTKGRTHLRVRRGGSASVFIDESLYVGAPRRVRIESDRLRPNAPPGESPDVCLTGTVLDGQGDGLRAAVILLSADVAPEMEVARATSSDTGEFRFIGIPPGPYRIVARPLTPEGRTVSGRPQSKTSALTLPASGLTLRVPLGLTLAGRIVDDLNAPIPHLLLTVTLIEDEADIMPPGDSAVDPPSGVSMTTTTTDASGAFRVSHLRPGRYALRAAAGTSRIAHPWLIDAESLAAGDQRHTVRATRARSVAGRLHSQGGQPISGMRILAVRSTPPRHDRTTLTDVEGRFQIAGLDPMEDYQVMAVRRDGTPVGSLICRVAESDVLLTAESKEQFGTED